MIAACYSMDLYCRHEELPLWFQIRVEACPKGYHNNSEFPHVYNGETFTECKKQAVKDGWKFHRDGDVTCPRCNGKEKNI